MSSPTNAVLMDNVAGGFDDALTELYPRYAPYVERVARRIVGDGADAEDVVQTVFVQLWRQANRYDARRGSLEAWLFTLARTRALDLLRSRSSRRESPEQPSASPTRSTGIEDRLAVRRALQSLNPPHRRTIELAYYEGMTQTEIAARLGQPLGTIKTRSRVALRRLRQALTTPASADEATRLGDAIH